MSKLMRISDISIQRINSLSDLTGESKQKIIDRALMFYEHEQLLKKANEQYAAIKKDPKALREMQAEMDEWDVTLGDEVDDRG